MAEPWTSSGWLARAVAVAATSSGDTEAAVDNAFNPPDVGGSGTSSSGMRLRMARTSSMRVSAVWAWDSVGDTDTSTAFCIFGIFILLFETTAVIKASRSDRKEER